MEETSGGGVDSNPFSAFLEEHETGVKKEKRNGGGFFLQKQKCKKYMPSGRLELSTFRL